MPDSFSPIISAGLKRRLDAASSGFQDGQYHCFVCRLDYPYDLRHISADTDTAAKQAAETLADELNVGKPIAEYYYFGSYRTPLEFPRAIPFDFIRISFIQSDNVVYTKDLPPDADAVIFGIEAFDKFMYKYYKRLYGRTAADSIRAAVVNILKADPADPVGPTFRMMTPHARSTLLYDVPST